MNRESACGLSELRFYFDESVELAVSSQLAAAGLDVVSARRYRHESSFDESCAFASLTVEVSPH